VWTVASSCMAQRHTARSVTWRLLAIASSRVPGNAARRPAATAAASVCFGVGPGGGDKAGGSFGAESGWPSEVVLMAAAVAVVVGPGMGGWVRRLAGAGRRRDGSRLSAAAAR